jgi:hypothetical protein
MCKRRRRVRVSRSLQRINSVSSRDRERFSGSSCAFGRCLQPPLATRTLVTESG